jgi:hypothetical protein
MLRPTRGDKHRETHPDRHAEGLRIHLPPDGVNVPQDGKAAFRAVQLPSTRTTFRVLEHVDGILNPTIRYCKSFVACRHFETMPAGIVRDRIVRLRGPRCIRDRPVGQRSRQRLRRCRDVRPGPGASPDNVRVPTDPLREAQG